MNKMTAIYFDQACEKRWKLGTTMFVGAKSSSHRNQAFTTKELKEWIKGLEKKNDQHPVIADLKKLDSFIKRNKIDLVLW